MEKLKHRKGIIKGQLTRLKNYIDANGGSLTYDDLKVRCDNVHKLYTEFISTEDAIFEIDATTPSEMDTVDDQYYAIIPKLQSLIRAKSGSHQSSNHEQSFDATSNINPTSDFKLPSLTMPTFDGDLKNWQSFYDIFSSTVHENVSLSPAQKFKYLKGLLKGNAYNLISHLRVDDASYIEAIQRLIKRYDRKKPIVEAHIKSFLDQVKITKATAVHLSAFHDNLDEVVRGLKSLGKDAESRDPWLIFMAMERLDDETRKAWRYKSAEEDFPTLQSFLDFLLNRVDALTEVKSSQRKLEHKLQPVSKILYTESLPVPCKLCNGDRHRLFECTRFKSMALPERRNFLKENQRCFNCLGGNHAVYQCRSRRTCQICKRRHHTLIHPDPDDSKPGHQQSSIESASGSNSKPSTSETYTSAVIKNAISTNENAMLPTVLVEVKDNFNNWHIIRGLLDSGSTRSFLKESCANKLNLTKSNARVVVSGIGGTKAGTSKGLTHLTIRSRINRDITYQIAALIVPKLTSYLPTQSVDVDIPKNYEVNLADPTFNKPGPIDLLIGSDYFFDIINDGKVPISNPTLMAQNTTLGWIIGGRYLSDPKKVNERVYLSEHQDVDIDKTLRSFWETEDIPDTPQHTPEEFACIEHFEATVAVSKNGRISVGLPFKRIPPLLGRSYPTALRQFYALEKRLCANERLRLEYIKFMQDYQRLGHMDEIPQNEISRPDQQMFYLPHHGVFKNNTSKLRVVFNGSQKTSTGQSLNDELLIGPTVQQGLFEILLRYRKHAFVFSADIEKMYRQVRIRAEDTEYQRILWRESPDRPLSHYRLLTVTYGTSSAPFLATNSLNYIANQFQHKYPITAERVKSDIYVDDVLTGACSLSDALTLRDELMTMMNSAGFILKKWSANHHQLLDNIEEVDLQINDREFATSEAIISVLGLYYQPSRDSFKFRVCLPQHSTTTKRGLLSESSRIFDPMGWLSPIMITIKILFQTLWLQKLGWDDELPESCRESWVKVRNEFGLIEEIEIKRWLYTTDDTFEIHGFADASKDAYAAVLYSRVTTTSQEVNINIIAAKTKVAPIKTVSIPKLELCAATLLVKLMRKVTTALNCKTQPKQFFYTDSSIVLDWLSKPPKLWPTYIANRTGLILSHTNRNQWYHVQSKQNPADRATRGVTPSDFKHDVLWWKGPCWLSTNPLTIPEAKQNFSCESEAEPQAYFVQNFNEFEHQLEEMMSRVSSYLIVVRIIARMQRLLHNAKRSNSSKTTGNITVDEFNNAETYVIKHIQRQSYQADIETLQSGKPSNKTKLKLYPFLDIQGILRVSGRLSNSSLHYDTQHPIILPSSHIVVKRMIQYFHRKLCHAGTSHMMAYVKQRFHIVRAKHLIKSTINQCLKCHRYRKKVQQQMMGQLPSPRVNLVRPFIQSGIDYAGPYLIKAHQLRNSKIIKGYICIFTCMATKAIHIELVTNLSTDSFIAALRRFQSTRGICSDLFSDNATNFIGAINQLQEMRDLLQSENFSNKVIDWTVDQGTKWHLIPPAAPNFGGLWEAAVKSTKFHIKRVIGETILNYEEFLTFLKQVEAILNSRPLCRNDDSDDPLTPAHFILGHPITLAPESTLIHTRLNTLSRWHMLQKLIQHFWRRWNDEYLTTLNQLNKLNQASKQIKIDDLVILKDENISPARWPLARVVQVHPGRDNLIRVVTVKTATSTFKRPITKLCLIPSIDSYESRAGECSASSSANIINAENNINN